MNSEIKPFVDGLKESPFELTESHIKKIHVRIPVPNDFKILWADINSLDGYPSGVVVTDKALIYKAPKDIVKEQRKNSIDNAEKDDEKRLAKSLKIIYRIIPWDYFDPTLYDIESEDDGEGKITYKLYLDGELQTAFTSNSLYSFFNDYKEETIKLRQIQEEINDASIFSADNTMFFEDTVFDSAYGSGNSKTGFGIYGEEASTKLDKLHGEDSSVVGRDNAKSGPDKIVNGQAVQMKCYKNGASSVNACFDKNTKQFKYYDHNGDPMQIEVPSDQYNDAIKQLQKKISEGKVPGVTDPNEASNLIRKSKLNSKQIHNLAKAGTFESLTYDAATGAVQCAAVCGLSALISFGFSFWQTKDLKKSAKVGLHTGLEVFGPAFASKILVSQLARTGISKAFVPFTTEFTKSLSPKVRQTIINALRALAGKGPIYGAAAQKSLAKALGTNLIVEGITFAIYLVPNTVKLISKKCSGAQFIKTMTSLVASIGGSAGGALGTGAVLGKTGEKFAKSAKGKIIATAGGTLGGLTLGFGARKIADFIREDDAIITTRMFQACLTNMCSDYLLMESEMDMLIDKLGEKEFSKSLKKFQSKLLAFDNQYYSIEEFLKPVFEEIVSKREIIDISKQEEMINAMSEVVVELSEGGQEYEM